MNKLEILKGGAEILVSIGVGSIVGNAIKITTDPEAGRIKKLAIGIGGFVLSQMVSDKAGEYATQKIDSAAEKVSKLINLPEESEDSEPVEPESNQKDEGN